MFEATTLTAADLADISDDQDASYSIELASAFDDFVPTSRFAE